jgi:hypothetical protein
MAEIILGYLLLVLSIGAISSPPRTSDAASTAAPGASE